MRLISPACQRILRERSALIYPHLCSAIDAGPRGVGEVDSILKSSVLLSTPVTGEVFRSCTVSIVVVVVAGVAILDQVQAQLTSSSFDAAPARPSCLLESLSGIL